MFIQKREGNRLLCTNILFPRKQSRSEKIPLCVDIFSFAVFKVGKGERAKKRLNVKVAKKREKTETEQTS